MNLRVTEVAQKKKNSVEFSQLLANYRLLFIAILVVVFAIWLFPLLNLGLHYLQWRKQNIDNYELYFHEAGVILPNGIAESIEYDIYHTDGTKRHTEVASLFKPEYDSVQILFETALERAWHPNPFSSKCSVSYENIYGFPTDISCGSLQRANGGWLWMTYFQAIDENTQR